jgi:hypothetical protein
MYSMRSCVTDLLQCIPRIPQANTPSLICYHTKTEIHVLYKNSGPPLWSSGSWLQIQRFGFDSRRYKIFCQVVGLERGHLSLVSTIEELLGRKYSGFGLESREYGRGDPSRRPRDTLYPQKLTLTSPTSGGGSVGIVRSRTKATELCYVPTLQKHSLCYY